MQEAPTKSPTGFDLKFGTYEQAKAMIGAKSEVFFSDVDVNVPMIKYYAAHLEDANPSYWDEDFATQAWGGIVSPPGMLMSWLMPLPWKPQAGVPRLYWPRRFRCQAIRSLTCRPKRSSLGPSERAST